MRATVAAAFLLIVLPLTLAAPAAQACSLAIPSPMEQVAWVSEDAFVTYTGSGIGLYNLTRQNFTATFEPLMVRSFAVQPGGDWVVAAYWDGGLEADCSHPIEATHAFNLQTLERVELFQGAARSFATNSDHVLVFAAGCHAPVRFAWGQWSEPEFIDWPPSTRPDLEAGSMQRAAMSPNGRHVALLDDSHVRVHDLRENEILYEERWPKATHNPHPVFAFDATGTRLAYAATGDSSTLFVLRDAGDRWALVSLRSEPAEASGDVLTGSPAWRGVGLVAPTSQGVRAFSDATNLSRSVDHNAPGENAYALGHAAWSPRMDMLAVGLQVRRSDTWSEPTLWLLDGSYETVDELPLYRGPREPTAWQAALHVDPACEIPHFEPPRPAPFETVPSLSLVTVMVLGALVVATRRIR